VTLTSRSSFHGISESADVLLAPLIACLFVGGAKSSTF
jgi:MFS-type transporter involved in bile tolerance (Atg22 family)